MERQADRARDAGDPGVALAAYEEILRRTDGLDGAEALGWLLWATDGATQVHREAGRDGEALALFERARAICLAQPERDAGPVEARVPWGHAWMLSKVGRDGEADLLVTEIRERFGDDADDPAVRWARGWAALPAVKALLDRGQELSERFGRGAEAEAAFREAMALVGSPHAGVLLGSLLLGTRGRVDEARRCGARHASQATTPGRRRSRRRSAGWRRSPTAGAAAPDAEQASRRADSNR